VKPPTDRDMETLGEIIGATDSRYRNRGDGVSPMEFGGSNGSHHGATATKLTRYGYVEHRQRGKDWGDVTTRDARGSKVYRATEAGRAAFAEWWEARKNA
jgi:hypothetical protein